MMATKDNFIFKALQVIAWFIFIGLSIEAGGLIINFGFSLYKPEFVSNLYQKLNLLEMYGRSKWAFFGMYSFILSIAILKRLCFMWWSALSVNSIYPNRSRASFRSRLHKSAIILLPLAC